MLYSDVQYTWTEEAFAALPPSVEPHQVMRMLQETKVLRIWYTSDVLAMFGRSPDGVDLVVFVSEDDHFGGIEAWLIEGARPMFPGEARRFRDLVGGTDG